MLSPGRPLSVLSLAAHCDDAEIGAGGLLLSLSRRPSFDLTSCTLSGGASGRGAEARAAARAISATAAVEVHDLPDGRFPAHWATAKDLLQSLRARCTPDVILAPHPGDAHQDHRLLAELVPQVWRNVLVLGYEIPKWDGDLSRPNAYLPLDPDLMAAKWRLLDDSYPSQREKGWWDPEVVAGLARLRGIECASRYAEAFHLGKAQLEI